jgi:hypothetical protein
MTATCTVPRLADIPGTPLDPRWDALPRLAVASYHARSSPHRPPVHVQLGHSGDRLHLRFTVQDRYVLSRATAFNAKVCNDSCVEMFFEPVPGMGYFNLEMNAGGTALCYHITDARRVPDGFAAFTPLTADELGGIAIVGTAPRTVDPEIAAPLDWALCASIPLAPFARRLGRALPVPGRWRGNFFKCADESSHPHWASWSPIGEELNFHQPGRFGVIELLD